MKQKQFKKLITILLAISLVTMFGFSYAPFVKDANAVGSIKWSKDTLSDSGLSATSVTHTLVFTPLINTPNNGYYQVLFGTLGNVIDTNITCPGTMTRGAPDTHTAKCTANGIVTAATSTIVVAAMTNPAAAATPEIEIDNVDSSGTVLERTFIRVAFLSKVTMTARVDATLTFTLSGVNGGTVVNNIPCSATTTATTTPFGTLSSGASTTVCQQLAVQTNARNGYNVVVWEDRELSSSDGANINSFDNSPDNTGSSTAHAWANATGILDLYNTYGHMGLTADDTSLSDGSHFFSGGNPLFQGFNGTTGIEVLYHNGPADGTTTNKGLGKVAYSAYVTALQEAGDYTNTLTYIATPIY
jgi:hypothetical protein